MVVISGQFRLSLFYVISELTLAMISEFTNFADW